LINEGFAGQLYTPTLFKNNNATLTGKIKVSAVNSFIVLSLPNEDGFLIIENLINQKYAELASGGSTSWDFNTIKYITIFLAVALVVLYQYYKYTTR
jgi:hypothetical protein